MKILYISNFLDGTGYSQAATNYVRAMDSVGLDVVCRNIKLNNRNVEPHPKIKELLDKPASGAEVCIQHTLPHIFSYDGRFKKCVGLFAYETQPPSIWFKYINTMSELWVVNHSMCFDCKSEVDIPIRIVPHTYNPEEYKYVDDGDLGIIGQHKKQTGSVVFYTIGEFVRRKDLGSLIKAFHTAFHRNESVSLVIKTSKDGSSSEECQKEVRDYINKIKVGLKLYNKSSDYKQEMLLTERMSPDELAKLHNEADVFVQTSHGEAWSQPGFDALAYGKPIIVPGHTGFLEYSYDADLRVKSHEDICFGAIDSNFELYNSNCTWYNVDILDLQRKMRRVYNEIAHYTKPELRLNRQKSVERFSYLSIGNEIRRMLESER